MIIYQKNLINAYHINKYIVNDSFGIKKIIYQILNKISFNNLLSLPSYSSYRKKLNMTYLNIEHKTWNHPAIKEQTYKKSFEDLYNESIDKAIIIINKVCDVLYNNQELNTLKNYIPDICYSTGLPTENNKTMHFFEY